MKFTIPANYSELTPLRRRLTREEYVRRQGGLCHHCGEPLDGAPAASVMSKPINWKLFPPTFRKHPVHLHHCHKTGMTIGAVHAQCNAVLWQYFGE